MRETRSPTRQGFRPRDLRKGRHSEPNRIYLVTTNSHGRRQIFKNLDAARIVIGSLRFMHERERAITIAFTLMPDHLHWLLQPGAGYSLGDIMRSVKGYSTWLIQRRIDLKGRIWQAGYHDHAVRRHEDLKSLARYVIANPLRAGLVERIGDYPHWDAEWL